MDHRVRGRFLQKQHSLYFQVPAEVQGMDELSDEIRGARRKILALVQITRSMWVANAIVLAIALVYAHAEVAALAGFSLVLALLGAATARRASSYLRDAVRTIRMSHL